MAATTDRTTDRTKTDGALYWRALPSGEEIVVYPMTFGKARLCLGHHDGLSIIDAWCYEDPWLAITAATIWTGEGDPLDGWHRNPHTGRRRPGGDPSKEYNAP